MGTGKKLMGNIRMLRGESRTEDGAVKKKREA